MTGYHNDTIPLAEVEEITPMDGRCPIPEGFVLTETGIFLVAESQRGAQKVYDYDIYPSRLWRDEIRNCEMVTFRHLTPHNGWKHAEVRVKTLRCKKQLFMKLADKSVQVPTTETGKELFFKFIQEYVKKLAESLMGVSNYASL